MNEFGLVKNFVSMVLFSEAAEINTLPTANMSSLVKPSSISFSPVSLLVVNIPAVENALLPRLLIKLTFALPTADLTMSLVSDVELVNLLER